MNELGNQLAQLSLKAGMDNLGVIYQKAYGDGSKTFSHLRSYPKGVKPGSCDKLAEIHGGGGHKGAASIKITTKEFNKMKRKWYYDTYMQLLNKLLWLLYIGRN